MLAYDPFTPQFDQFVHDALTHWHVPGISFAVVKDDSAHLKGYGVAQQPSAEVTGSTLFYAASTTKAQTSAAWALYISSDANQSKPKAKQISFSTPLADIIRDDFVLSDPIRTQQVTIEDALSHRTGMPAHECSYGYEGTDTVMGVTRNLRHLPLHNELRANFEYCNTMYMAATHALEVVVGKSYGQIMRDSLWTPLGMKQTYAGYDEAAEAVRERGEVLAKGYTWSKMPCDPDEQNGHLTEEAYMDMPEVSGAGYVISNAVDYAKWMRCFLNPGSGPLTEAIVKELSNPRAIPSDNDSENAPFDGVLTYALGWYVTSYKGHKVLWHPGGLTGAGSLLTLVPDLKWGVMFFANGAAVSETMKGVVMELLDDVLSIPDGERYARKKQQDHFLKLCQQSFDEYNHARERLFPQSPTAVTVPLALPIEQYAGTYSRAGYGRLAVEHIRDEEGKDCLLGRIVDASWLSDWTFQHVNAGHWMMTRSAPNNPYESACKAVSRVGSDGKAEAFGIPAGPSMPDTLFWFER